MMMGTKRSKLIAADSSYLDESLKGYDQDDHKQIRQLLLGHKIERIADDHLRLDDGTVAKVVPNRGECCAAGDYQLDDLNGCDNIVTSVEFEEGVKVEDGSYDTVYRVFVVAEDKRINLFAVSGDDGSGYYGTGYELLVRYPDKGKGE